MSQLKYLRSVPASTLESATGDIHKDIETQTLDAGVESMNKDIVPDDVRDNTDANKIEPDVVNTHEAVSHEDHVEDTYRELVGGMKVGLQKLALANAMDESVIVTAESIYESAEENNIPFNECEGYDNIVEAVVAAMSKDQINMENAVQFVMEAADFIISEGGMRKYKRAVEKNLTKTDEVPKNNVSKSAIDFVKNHKKQIGAVGAGAALAGGAVYAAKKIADKKKAAKQNQEEVKENYEYEEYTELVEAVIDSFTNEELMSENVSEMACKVADILIEKSMDVEDLITNDDDDADIEAIAGNNDPKVDLHYDYDDDELIDMVVNDTNL